MFVIKDIMCSVIEIKTPSEYTIRYETDDASGPLRVQRTRNVKLIRIDGAGESSDESNVSYNSFTTLHLRSNMNRENTSLQIINLKKMNLNYICNFTKN